MADDYKDDEPSKFDPSDDEILAEARRDYKAAKDSCEENLKAAKSDLNFLKGGEAQWDDTAVAGRKLDGRPIITVNSLPTYLHQVTNDQRMNTPAIKVHPVDDRADVETAKVRQGLIRHIEYDSNADVAYDTAVNSAAAVGFGYFRLLCEWDDTELWAQNIVFNRIRNALSVKLDPLSVEPDGSDMGFAFVELKMSRDSFKVDYPKAKASSSTIFNEDTAYADWITDTDVLVCDYYKIRKKAETVVLLSNGESGFEGDLLELPDGVTIVKKRPGVRRKTMLYKITGVDILERTEIKCRWIPVFPVYGDEIDIEGKVTRSGIIRNAKGPCQSYNVFMTSATEEVLLRTKAPYIGAEGQFEGYEDEWEQANTRAYPYLQYKPVALDGKLAPPPQRQPMADVPTGFIAMAMHASDNIKRTTGLFDASLGARGTATSGKQEIAQQREGDVANFHFTDGLNRTIRHCGRCINDMIPHYYDTDRTVRIIGEDDQASYVRINAPNVDQKRDKSGQVPQILNDMTAGKYDITVTAGPSYTTMRQENAEFFANAMSAARDPAHASVFGYLAIRNQDVPGGETATRMIEALLPPQAKAILDQENAKQQGEEQIIPTPQGPLPISQVPAVLSQLQAQIGQLNEAIQKAQIDKQHAEMLREQTAAMKQQEVLANQQLEPARIQAETLKAQADLAKAEADRIKAEAELARAQAEAAAAPERARAEATKADTDHMTAEINLLNAHQQALVTAREAEAAALNGNESALEVWKAGIESETKIIVAQIMAHAAEKRAQARPKGNENAQER